RRLLLTGLCHPHHSFACNRLPLAVLWITSHSPLDILPFLSVLLSNARIDFSLLETQFRLQLAVVLQPLTAQFIIFNCRFHRAARLAMVTAIAKFATNCKLLDFSKRLCQPRFTIPELQLTHARRINDHTSLRKHD